MGASKRLAELVVQVMLKRQPRPFFLWFARQCARFFRLGRAFVSPPDCFDQFYSPEIIRYFMTIPEAATLVLQSSVLAQGGDLFLLDMGEPVRIKTLAEQMVRLSGLSLRDTAHPDGDIEIVCTGLRPGEKLYEELLIDAESQPTAHPLIYRAKERSIPPDYLWPQLGALEQAIAAHDVNAALELLAELVPEWHRSKA